MHRLFLALFFFLAGIINLTQAADFSVISAGVQPKMVKVYGAGGLR